MINPRTFLPAQPTWSTTLGNQGVANGTRCSIVSEESFCVGIAAARIPVPVAGPRSEDRCGPLDASSVSWLGSHGLLARSGDSCRPDLHRASRDSNANTSGLDGELLFRAPQLLSAYRGRRMPGPTGGKMAG